MLHNSIVILWPAAKESSHNPCKETLLRARLLQHKGLRPGDIGFRPKPKSIPREVSLKVPISKSHFGHGYPLYLGWKNEGFSLFISLRFL